MNWKFLGIATDIQQLVETGRNCYGCGTEFVQPHGHKVLCPYCWRNTMPPQRDGCVKATHNEADVAHAKAKAAAKRYAINCTLRKACPNDTLDDSPPD